jgi:DnaJ like chaperone protein
MAKFGKWIGGGLGWAFGGPIGGLVGFVIGTIVDGATSVVQYPAQQQTGQTTTGGYIMSLLVLVASVMKADGKVMKSELMYVKSFLVHNFGEESASEAIRMLRDLLDQSIPVTDVCHQIERNMNYPSRLQLLHFLFGIALADGIVDKNEIELIHHISRSMGITEPEFESIQAMFIRDTKADFTILEIEPTASDDEVKQAYRAMAKKYHPDMVSYLGEDFQKAAKEKFQKVNEAYENIKKERNMV